jgi:hypothetical protein
MSTQDPIIGQLCIQVHLARSPKLNSDRLKNACEVIAKSTPGIRGIGINEGEEDGPYLNIVLAADAPEEVCPGIRLALLESADFGRDLKASCMCVCTGQNGWDDYLLLYHFDPGVPLDEARDA